MKRGPKPAKPIVSLDLCKFGCGKLAKFITHSGNLICESSANKCLENRKKNATSSKQSYANGRVCAIPHAARLIGVKISSVRRQQKSIWIRTKAPWELVNKSARRDRILFEQSGVCAICKRKPVWLRKPLSLHLDHVLGKQHGDERENLRLICPNCHSQTPTFGSRNASAEGKEKMKAAFDKGRRNRKPL